MAEELQCPMPTVEHTAVLESIEQIMDTSKPHAEHEGVESQPADETSAADSMPINHTADGTTAIQPDDAPTALEVASPPEKNDGTSKSAVKQKPAVVVKAAVGAKNGPTSPLVKRIINSGTFGAGTVKPTAPKSSIRSPVASKPTTTAPPLKKSISAPPSKPDMASSKPSPSTGVSTSISGTAPTRRASLAPAKPSAPPISKPSLSSSTSAKPSTTPATRPTVVSPAGSSASVKSSSATRPRASVSEGVKRAPLASRQSLSATSKPPTTPAKSSAVPTRMRGVPSISSITEVKEDPKALEGLQNKLKEAEDLLTSKTEAVATLEDQVNTLKTSLDAVRADVEAKQLAVQQLEETRAISEKELKDAREALEIMRTQREEGDVILRSVQQTLEVTKANAITQTDLIQNLQPRIQTLETEVLVTKENFEILKASNDSAVAAAAVEHEALMKAKADLDAIQVEAQALQCVHVEALEEAAQKLRDVERKAARSEALEAEVAELKKEREENANRLSELEVEILELKESQETVGDQRSKLLTQLNELEEGLSQATASTQQAVDNAKLKEEEYTRRAEDAGKAHREELKTASEEQAKLVAQLEVLKSELVIAQAAHEQAKADARVALEDHTRRIDEAEKTHLHMQNELSEKIKRITTELGGQEVQYNIKVDAVKAEHGRLLQDAFERAKNEAGEAHRQDLQTLRAESQVTTEELRTAHRMTIDNLKAEHAVTLESEIRTLEKQINHQNIELKATQDDLAKAKTALDSARGEVEALTAQRDEARAAAAASPSASPDHAEEIERLNQELTNTKDDLAATSEMLNLTKVSLSDMSLNHQRELEEAAKGRAEEVTALRTAHDNEVTALATRKSELLIRLSDLEGELATAKASATVEPPAAPKSNGTVHPLAGVTKEELQRMHEAHNSKVHDLQADHNRAICGLKEELEKSMSQAETFQQDIARKAMEIQYLEQEQDENQDQITRLKEDLVNLTEQFEQYKAQNKPVAA